MEKGRGSKLLMLVALGFSGGTMYLYPYIRYVFYDWQLEAMGLSNAQLGFLVSIYGIFATILYIPAGFLADKFSPKKIILLALVGLALGTIGVAVNMDGSYAYMLCMWTVMAIPGGLFWGALFKEIRGISGEENQGFYFGFYYMCNGLTGALGNFVSMKIGDTGETVQDKFFLVTVVCAVMAVVAIVLIAVLIDEKKAAVLNGRSIDELEKNDFKFAYVGQLLRTPVMWAFAFLILAGYMVYTCNSYFTPYLSNVVGLEATDAGLMNIIRTYLFYLLTPISGMIADKVFKSTSKWFMFLYFVLAILYFGVMFIPATASTGFVILYSLLPGLFGLAMYGIQFSIAGECKIPLMLMGTATGIASTVGYSSDIWSGALIGHWLDVYGNAGYNRMFIMIGSLSVLGFIMVLYIYRNKNKVNLDLD